MKKQFFKHNFLLFLIPSILPLLILGSFSIYFANIYTQNSIKQNTQNLLIQTRSSIDLIVNELDQLAIIFDVNSQISVKMDMILQENGITYESSIASAVINEFLTADKIARPYIHSIYVYYSQYPNTFFASSQGRVHLNDFYDTGWYQDFLSYKQEEPVWTTQREFYEYSFEKNRTQVVSVFHRMKLRNGVLVLNISVPYIRSLLEKITLLENQDIFILSGEGELLFSNTEESPYAEEDMKKITERVSTNGNELFPVKIAGKDYIVSTVKSEKFNWTYLSVIPEVSLYRLSKELSQIMFFLTLAVLLSALILAYKLANKNHRQLSRIIDVLEAAERGTPLPPYPKDTRDEYSYILFNILNTFVEQSYLKVALSEQKYKQKTTELLVLQGQINHHFLFNTLKTIYWKTFALTERPNVACNMIENLSNILYYTLETSGELVTVAQELEYTQDYIEIQKVRFAGRFKVIWQYGPEVESCCMPKLLLQPLVENCITHGIADAEKPCVIKIRIFIKGKMLHIRVIDNGKGIEKEKLEQMKHRLARDEYETSHIGIYNNNRRLKIQYGEEYGIQIHSRLGLGTSVKIRVPLSEKENK